MGIRNIWDVEKASSTLATPTEYKIVLKKDQQYIECFCSGGKIFWTTGLQFGISQFENFIDVIEWAKENDWETYLMKIE